MEQRDRSQRLNTHSPGVAYLTSVNVTSPLDRLSRSLKDLLHVLEQLDKYAAAFRSLTEGIETTGPAGRMMMHMRGSFTEFERAMVRERTQAGLKNARVHGRVGGRQPKLTPDQKNEVKAMLDAGRSAADIARLFRVHRATISRVVAQDRASSKALFQAVP